MSIDDEANVTTIRILTNSGGAQFTNGIQVTGGGSITYDQYNSLQLSPLGTQITGPFLLTGNI